MFMMYLKHLHTQLHIHLNEDGSKWQYTTEHNNDAWLHEP